MEMTTLDVLCPNVFFPNSSVNPAAVDVFQFYPTSICLAKTLVLMTRLSDA